MLMGIRERFEQDLVDVQQQFMQLCDLSAEALQQAFSAFVHQDIDLALSIIEADVKLNRLEEEISDRVILLIAKQQPVATDLRRLMILVKAANDVERIGDYAVNIAKETIRIGKQPFVTSIEPIEQIYALTYRMLREISEAFIEENISKAKENAELDDEVDFLYGSTLQTYLRLTAVTPESIAQLTNLSFICMYLERCGDHATNLAEHLIYLVKGKHYELN
jgi:phosphate transport system protein